jgi:hypothetical protein
MDKGGFFLVYRGVFPDFGNAPYVERDAWLWLIASAGYEESDMGQISTSLSELAKAWNWTYSKTKRTNPNRVRRFLDKMAQQGRIIFCNNNQVNPSQSCNNLVTNGILITVCNYTKYQRKENGSVTSLSQVCNKQKLACNNDPSFVQSFSNVTSPKQKRNNTKEINNKTKNTARKPRKLPLPLDKQIERTKKDIQQRLDTHYKTKYPLVEDFDYQIELSLLWAEDNGREIKSFSTFFANWLRIANEKASKLPQPPSTKESFADQVKRESEKLKQINERFM